MTDRTFFDKATRVAAADDGTTYDAVAIFLHWTTAALVLFQFLTALTWDYFPRSTRQTMESLHISLGVVLTLAIVARLAWRLIPTHQVSSLTTGMVRLLSKAVHYLLYLLLAAQAATGFLFRWAQGHPVEVFGLFAIPSPIAAAERATRRQLHQIHEWIGYSIVTIAAVHALAALYHHYRLHDEVLGRMFPPARRRGTL